MSHDPELNARRSRPECDSRCNMEAHPVRFGELGDLYEIARPTSSPFSCHRSLSILVGIVAIIGSLALGGPTLLPAEASDGPNVEISGWASATLLPESLASRNALAVGDYVYLFGGRDAQDNSRDTIYRAPIQLNGTLGTWEPAGAMPRPLYLHATVVSENFIYIIGGWNTTEPLDTLKPNNAVWRGEILADGRIGNWVLESNYPIQITLHQAVVVNQRIFVLGGYDGLRSRPIDNVYYADINPNTGQLSGWQPSTVNLPEVIRRAAAVTRNVGGTDYIYLTGGSGTDTKSAFDSVYYSAVNRDGTLAGWQPGPDLPSARTYHAAVIHDGRLLILGGRNDDGEHRTVFAATINQNGTLGPWGSLLSMPEPVYRFGAVSIRRFGSDFVVVMGGYIDDKPKRNVYNSTIPNTPTPTPAPTPTPTPELKVQFDRSPAGWIGPGESVQYTLEFQAPSIPISDVQIVSQLPQNMVLLPDSLSANTDYEYSITNDTIFWQIGELEAEAIGQVTYELARPTPAPPPQNIPTTFRLTLFGPAAANPGELIEYQLELKNQAIIPLTDVVIVNTIPFGATYVDGNDSSTVSGEVSWQLPVIAPFATETFTYTVVANHTLLNNRYRVDSNEGASAVGFVAVTTNIEGRRPLVGDDFFIIHDGVQSFWASSGSTFEAESEALTNPSLSYYVPLHTVSQRTSHSD